MLFIYLFITDSICSGYAVAVIWVRTRTWGWLAFLHPVGGKGETLLVYNPFTVSGLKSCALIIPSRRKSSLTLWSSKRLPLPISETWQSPCWANQCLQVLCPEINPFLAKLDAPPGYQPQWEGARAAKPGKFKTRPLKHNKGILQVTWRLYHNVLLGRVQKKEKKFREFSL